MDEHLIAAIAGSAIVAALAGCAWLLGQPVEWSAPAAVIVGLFGYGAVRTVQGT